MYASNTQAHPATKNFAGSIRTATSSEPMLRRSERMLEVDEHHVITAGLERDGFARLDFEATLDRPHFYYTVFHTHAVNLTLRSGVSSGASENIRRAAGVGHGQIGRAGTSALRRGAHPWLRDVDRSDIVNGGSRAGPRKRQRCPARRSHGLHPHLAEHSWRRFLGRYRV